MVPSVREDGRIGVVILGCTGSIGTQALDVCRKNPEKIRIVALSAHTRTSELVAFAREFDVDCVAVTDDAHADDPVLEELPDRCRLLRGPRSAVELVHLDSVDAVLVAIVGAAGLEASHAALSCGRRLALANKESLVVGGELLMPLAQPGQLLPVDSEHSAIYQCLIGESTRSAHCIWLTCSGGPFYGRTARELSMVTPRDALAHPTWNMGAKITIDSATLMNKGLERIEAMHLYGMDLSRINVLIQRESKIHSMVEFADGSVIAHLGASDMRIPIQFAFSYPDRWDTPASRVDFRALGSLMFGEADMETFRCLELAQIAGEEGGTMPCVLNAANEIAVDAFLHKRLRFDQIARVVEVCMDSHDRQDVSSLGQLRDVDAWARERASRAVAAFD